MRNGETVANESEAYWLCKCVYLNSIDDVLILNVQSVNIKYFIKFGKTLQQNSTIILGSLSKHNTKTPNICIDRNRLTDEKKDQ